MDSILEQVIMILLIIVIDILSFAGLYRLQVSKFKSHYRYFFYILYWMVTVFMLTVFLLPAAGLMETGNAFSVSFMLFYMPKIIFLLFYLFDLVFRCLFFISGWILKKTVSVKPAAMKKIPGLRIFAKAGAVLAILFFVQFFYYFTISDSPIEINRFELTFDNLPESFDGVRIVHISDFHIDSMADKTDKVDQIVKSVNMENPDIIVHTGDYGEIETYDPENCCLKNLKANLGKFAVLGNHELGHSLQAMRNWKSPEYRRALLDSLKKAYGRNGFNLLYNESDSIKYGGGKIGICGVKVYDPHHGFFDSNIKKAVKGIENLPFKLLLSHNPNYWGNEISGKIDIDLTLAGHTHAAQYVIGFGKWEFSPAFLNFPLWNGLHKSEDDDYLYINTGIGYVGLPVRIGVPSEIAVITLKSGAAD